MIGISRGVQGPVNELPRESLLVLEVFEAGNVVEGAPAATLVVDVPSSRVVKLVVTVGISNSDAGSSKNLLSIVGKFLQNSQQFCYCNVPQN